MFQRNKQMGPWQLSVAIWWVVSISFAFCEPAVAREPEEWSDHSDAVYCVTFSPDSQVLASGSYDESVKLWDVPTGRVIATLRGHQDQIYRVAFSPDGKRLASCSADGSIRLWRVSDGALERMFKGHQGPVLTVEFSPDGKRLASGGFDSTLRIWDVEHGELVQSMRHTQPFFSVAFSRDQKSILGGTNAAIQIRQASDMAPTTEIKAAGGVCYQLAFAPKGFKFFASASSQGALRLWDSSTFDLVEETEAESNGMFTVAYSPDGKLLATGGRDRLVRLWSVPKLEQVESMDGPQETILSVAFSPDGKYIASGSYDGRIHVWNRSVP